MFYNKLWLINTASEGGSHNVFFPSSHFF